MASEKQDDSRPDPSQSAKHDDDQGGMLDQDAIDALLAGGAEPDREDTPPADSAEDVEPPHPEPDAEPDEEELTQEALDALLAQMGAEDAPTAAELTDDTPLAPDSLDTPLGHSESTEAPVLNDSREHSDDVLAGERSDSVLQGDEASPPASADAEPHPEFSDEPLGPTPPTPEEHVESETTSLSEDQINAILAESQTGDSTEGTTEDVGGENLAAAVHEESSSEGGDDLLLTQDMLDQLIDQARKEREEAAHTQPDPWLDMEQDEAESDESLLSELRPAPAAEPPPPPPDEAEAAEPALPTLDQEAASAPPDTPLAEPAPAPAPKKQKRKAVRVSAGTRRDIYKLVASLTAGIMAGAAVYMYGTIFPTRGANLQALNRISAPALEEVLPQARELIALEKYGEAVDILEPSMRGAEAGPDLTAAEYLRIHALYRGMAPYATDGEIQALMRDIDAFTVDHAADPRAAHVLLWRGRLYEQQGIPFAARQAYEQILMDFPEAPDRDRLHFDVARLSLDLGRSYDAVESLRTLLQQHPASPYAGEGKLLLADAHLAAGERAVARRLYEQLAETAPNSAVGGQAYSRLGRMAYDEGRYGDAIALLEERRRRATTIEGNDEVFLLLGQSYRAMDRLDEAERVLRELIDFFPESAVMPKAYDELAVVLDALGRRDEALQVARQASERYPGNAGVLRQAAELLDATGQHRAAAEKYLEAETAGIRDPAMLLAAAEAYERAGFTNSAMDVYRRTTDLYPTTAEAVDAAIAYARLLDAEGSTGRAIDRLESLALTLGPGPERMPVLVSLARIYRELGASDRAGELYAEVASNTTDPNLLAESAKALLDARRWAEGFALAARVDHETLEPDAGYSFLMAQADAYLRTDSNRAIMLMEQARDAYPEERTEAGDEALFRAYLATDQPARARAMLTEIRARAEAEPIYSRQLRERALAWGDYSFDRRDFREAAEAYALAVNPQGTSSDDHHWARFQRANALRHAGDVDTALELYDAIADSPSPWATNATIAARQIRLEQRLRHEAVTPAPVAEG